MKVKDKIAVLKPNNREAIIETYKLGGVYYLEVSHVNALTGLREDYKTSRYFDKNLMFYYKNLAIQYLTDKGIW